MPYTHAQESFDACMGKADSIVSSTLDKMKLKEAAWCVDISPFSTLKNCGSSSRDARVVGEFLVLLPFSAYCGVFQEDEISE